MRIGRPDMRRQTCFGSVPPVISRPTQRPRRAGGGSRQDDRGAASICVLAARPGRRTSCRRSLGCAPGLRLTDLLRRPGVQHRRDIRVALDGGVPGERGGHRAVHRRRLQPYQRGGVPLRAGALGVAGSVWPGSVWAWSLTEPVWGWTGAAGRSGSATGWAGIGARSDGRRGARTPRTGGRLGGMSRVLTPPRRRVDLRQLPVPAQYALAVTAMLIVIGIVWWSRAGTTHVAGWYHVAVIIGLVVLAADAIWATAGSQRMSARPLGSPLVGVPSFAVTVAHGCVGWSAAAL
jgi:hypothetical protein